MMSWTSDNSGAIQQVLKRHDSEQSYDSAAQVVSAYYSAAGTVYAKLRKQPLRVHYLWLLWWYRAQAIRYLDQVMRGLSSSMIRAADISSDSVDVLATVVWRLERRNHVRVIKKLLGLGPIEPELRVHTKAFLLMHKMRFGLCPRSEQTLRKVFFLAHETALEAGQQTGEEVRAGYGQACRVLRQLSEFTVDGSPCHRLCLRRARQYAVAGNVTDQLLKL